MQPPRPAVSGSTIEPKIHTNPSDDGRGRWRGSETLRPYRNSLPSMPRPTTISTTNVISTAAIFSNKPEPLPSSSGVYLLPEITQITASSTQRQLGCGLN